MDRPREFRRGNLIELGNQCLLEAKATDVYLFRGGVKRVREKAGGFGSEHRQKMHQDIVSKSFPGALRIFQPVVPLYGLHRGTLLKIFGK